MNARVPPPLRPISYARENKGMPGFVPEPPLSKNDWLACDLQEALFTHPFQLFRRMAREHIQFFADRFGERV